MSVIQKANERRELGRVSRDTKGPLGFHLEGAGLYRKLELTR